MESDAQAYLLKALGGFKRKIVVVSPDFKILAAVGEAVKGMEAKIVGLHCHEFFHEQKSPCDLCPIPDVDRHKKPAFRHSENEPGISDLTPCLFAYPVYSEDKIEFYVMMDFDLPPLTLLEEKVQRTNAFLRNLIRSSVDSVIAADKSGKILIFNKAAEKVIGYTEAEAIQSLDIRQAYPGDGAYEVMKKLRGPDHGGKGKLKSCKVDLVSKSGETIPISLNASIIYEGDKEVATIGFFHDLREELRIQAVLEKTRMQLLQAEKMASLGKLAAGVAHQLNNPLGGITLFTKLVLEEEDLPDTVQKDLTRVLNDAERCRDTVKELLEFTRQTRHLMQPHNINKAIERTLFLIEDQTLFHNIEIVKELQDELPPALADSQQINHLLMNLILNAAQAMEGRGRLTLKTEITQPDRISIKVSDSGPGIPEDVMPHIFEPFYTTKEEGKGTGLGLSLVYNIVENHQGSVQAKSQTGVGTTFIVELPVAKDQTGGAKIEEQP